MTNAAATANPLTTNPAPVVGMGVTLRVGSDCSAATIVEVSRNGKTIKVQRDTVRRCDNNGAYSEAQRYLSAPSDSAEVETITLRKDGRWLPKGIGLRTPGYTVTLGQRRHYRDPCF